MERLGMIEQLDGGEFALMVKDGSGCWKSIAEASEESTAEILLEGFQIVDEL